MLGSAVAASSLAAWQWHLAWQRGCASLHHLDMAAPKFAPSRGSNDSPPPIATSHHMHRDAPEWQQGGGNSTAAVVTAAVHQQHSAWQQGGSVKIGIAAVVASSLAVQQRHSAWLHSCASLRHRDMAAPAATNTVLPPRTGGNINGGGTNNQQSTKSTETATMTVMRIKVETKGTAVAVEAR